MRPPSLDDQIAFADYIRRSPATVGGAAGHREWSHFVAFGRGLDLVVNFSLMDREWERGLQIEEARTTWLVRRDALGWTAEQDVHDSADTRYTAGKVDLEFGVTSLRFGGGCYRLRGQSGDGSIVADLALRPRVPAALSRSVALGSERTLRWVVIPRLIVSGLVVVRGRPFSLDGVPGYHDHNWGEFSWDDDFTWEWACIVPELASDPWSLVYMRVCDRAKTRVLSQGVLVWLGERYARTFRDAEVEIATAGLLRQQQIVRVPSIMSLASPGLAADVPRTLRAVCAAGRDWLDVSLDLQDMAQIAIPSSRVAGRSTLLCELTARARVEGLIGGQSLAFDGRSAAEWKLAAL